MRSLIRLFAILVVCFVGIGFYRGWFSLSHSNSDPKGDKVNVNVSVDKAKMKSDIRKTEGKIKEEVKELEGKAKAKEVAK